jgi:hypothetical protein
MTPTQRRQRDIAAMIGKELRRNVGNPLWHPFHMTFTHDGWRLIRQALNAAVAKRRPQSGLGAPQQEKP